VKRLGFCLLLCTLLGVAHAESTRYVSDRLELPVRTGKSVKHKILRIVPSGTPLTILQTDPAGYSRVRTPEGESGWVLTRFLMDTPSAGARLADAERRVATLELEAKRMQGELETMTQRAEQAEQANETLQASSRDLEQELAGIRRTAAKALGIADQNKKLKRDLIGKEKELQALLQENARLKDNANDRWFMVGAIVTIVSFLLGFMVPRLTWQRRPDLNRF
jgi:SH3 domain protein